MGRVQRKWVGQVVGVLAIMGVIACTFAAVPAALANKIQDGSVVDFKAANDLGQTFDYYIRNYGVQILGSVVGIGSATQLGSRPGPAAGGIAGGVVMLFWPSIMGSGSAQANASVSHFLAWSPRLLVQSGQVLLEGSLGAMGLLALRARRRARATLKSVAIA